MTTNTNSQSFLSLGLVPVSNDSLNLLNLDLIQAQINDLQEESENSRSYQVLTYDGIIVLSYSFVSLNNLNHSNYLLHQPSDRLTESERIELKSFALDINYNIMNSVVVMY
jgi:hypothetical protein